MTRRGRLLPALTLGMRSVTFLSRMTRAARQEIPQSDFVRTARAKAERRLRQLSPRLDSHRDDLLLARRGRYVLTAIDRRDLPAVQGSILFLSMVFVIVNLVRDILYAKVDPRVAYD
jgi:peptide/nickel transport system permease protein